MKFGLSLANMAYFGINLTIVWLYSTYPVKKKKKKKKKLFSPLLTSSPCRENHFFGGKITSFVWMSTMFCWGGKSVNHFCAERVILWTFIKGSNFWTQWPSDNQNGRQKWENTLNFMKNWQITTNLGPIITELACEMHCNNCLYVKAFTGHQGHMDSNPPPPRIKGQERDANGHSNSSNPVKVGQSRKVSLTQPVGISN